MTNEKQKFPGFIKGIWPLLAMLALASVMAVTGAMSSKEEADRAEAASRAAMSDPAFGRAMSGAGYRIRASAWRGGNLQAYCARRDERGPLPCDPLPAWPGVAIILRES